MLKLGWDLVWTIINLIVLYLLMKKFLIGPIMGIMEKRKAAIADQLAHARTVNEQAEALKGQYEQALSSAKEESVQIIQDAKADAKQMSEGIVRTANEQAAKIIETAKETARQEKESAMQGAKTEIAQLAMTAATKLLMNGSSTAGNQMLYDEFLAKAGDANDTDRY